MKITLGNTLPPYPDFVEGIRRTHDRGYTLVPVQAKLSPAVTSTTCRLPFPMIFYKVMDNLEPILAIELMRYRLPPSIENVTASGAFPPYLPERSTFCER